MALLTASLVTLAVSYFLARSITKRIDRLRMATHQIAQGNYNVEVDDNGHDEVADLGRSFNQMTASLRESQQEIRRQEERRRQFMANAAHEMRTPGHDEVADLGRSFNQMTASLRESQQEIRRQEERRRQFMANAAHEMRTPLTTINGILEGLQYDAIPEEDKKHSIQFESQQEIRRQEERRRQFMANAAHEMRTPLTTINGILEGLQYDAIPEEDKKHSIQLMQNDTRRLIRLVNDNLDYEKIRTNQIAMERKVFDASAVLENLREQLAKKAKEKKDTLHLDVEKNLRVYADYDRFVQIMFNIIQNAIQFTDNGIIDIRKEKKDTLHLDVEKNLRVYADYDRFVQIMFNIIQNAIQFTDNGIIDIRGKRVEKGSQFEVQDNGIGMTPEQLENIWERYYKADRSRMNTKYGESGLGLAIVRQLVLLHGGEIDVKSQYGKGTTFIIFFPDREYAPHNIQLTNNKDKK